jgi:type I restriction enzyme R subunit
MEVVSLIRRRHLPHWDVPGGTYFVTSCLEGSIPATGRLDIARYRAELEARDRPPDMTEDDWEADCWKLEFARLDRWLDLDPAVRWLERPELAASVASSVMHFAGQRYDVIAYVVMPSHMHWVFQPRPEWVAALRQVGRYRSPRERIMYSLKRYTSNQCNRALGRLGTFWQCESYDHWIRDADELERIIRYIEANPVKAGLAKNPEEWVYSSAAHRLRTGTRYALPLPKEVRLMSCGT